MTTPIPASEHWAALLGGQSRHAFCRTTGIARANFFHWARGRRAANSTVLVIATALGRPVEEIRALLDAIAEEGRRP